MNMLLITYKDNKNSFVEEMIQDLAARYHGEVVSDFKFDAADPGFSAEARFPTKDQENAFRKSISDSLKKMGIEMSFGGVY